MNSRKSIWEWGGHNIKLMAKAIPYYVLGTGQAPSPKIAKFDITYRCNFRCKMCFYWNDETLSKTVSVIREGGKELSLSDIQKYLVPQLNAVGLEYLSITGGEPCQREDIYEILSLLGKQEFRVSLNSNLPNIGQKEVQQIVNSHLFSIQLSLHGSQQVHDFISGKEGAFFDVIQTIKRINACKIRVPTRYPKLVICCVVSSYNQNHLLETLWLAEELGVDTLFFHFMEWQDESLLARCDKVSRAKMTQRDLLHINVDTLMTQVKKVVRFSKKLRTKIYFHPLHYPFTKFQLRQWYYNPKFSRVRKCLYLWLETRIDPYGWVLPCYYIDQPMGNIKEQELASIWNCEKYRVLRKQVSDGLLPMCYKCCKLSRQWQNFLFHI